MKRGILKTDKIIAKKDRVQIEFSDILPQKIVIDKFNAKKFEPKWQKEWEESKIYEAKDPQDGAKGDKYYVLDMFPYPSGDGLHVGHFKGYTATDAIARYLRMNGFNVLHSIGWDAFGLPAENYAIKTGVHPRVTTIKNIKHIKEQIKAAGLSYDWSREIDTTDPKYYKWTQWIFLQLFKNGLAYEAEAPINWCPKDKTGLANEEVVNGRCERCGTPVERKNIRQWILAITKYADRLLSDLEGLDWPEPIVEMQKNWIGRSEGAIIKFKVISDKGKGSELKIASFPAEKKNSKLKIPNEVSYIDVFTTRSDTLFGATYMVIAPEHELVAELLRGKWTVDSKQSLRPDDLGELKDIKNYIEKSSHKSDLERTDLAKEKTGVPTGLYAINPVNDEKIPIWISDYVLASYGTGAIMAVPAHDERDFEFAKKFDLPIREVVKPEPAFAKASAVAKAVADKSAGKERVEEGTLKEPFIDYGVLINSGKFDNLHSKGAIAKIIETLKKVDLATPTVEYRLRDWIFSRQRYWGEPIPIIHCPKCGAQAMNESDLPLLLPEVEKFEPTGTGESPLAGIDEWVNTTCPNCKGPAKRETNTMPQWAGSCWYYLRYLDPHNDKELVDPTKEKYWMGRSNRKFKIQNSKFKIPSSGGVDWYVGGAEHAVLHLLYARFWHKFLFDQGIVSSDEPFYKLRNVGLIMGADGQKMSKSRGNVVSPEEMINAYGADTLRVFEMFVGPFDGVAFWSPEGVEGVYRFLKRIWNLSLEVIEAGKAESSQSMKKEIARLNKKIASDIMEMKFNTAVAASMEFVNFATDHKDEIGLDVLDEFLKVLAPFAPHITEELWQRLRAKGESEQGKVKRSSPPFSKKNSQLSTLNSQFVSIHQQDWPQVDEKLLTESEVTIVIQVNGKVRDRITASATSTQEEVEKLALASDKVKNLVTGTPKNVIYVSGKLLNLVV